jgi:transposase
MLAYEWEGCMARRWGVVGCDSHKATLTLAAIDGSGTDVQVASFANDLEGYTKVVAWMHGLEIEVSRIGIEGSASWGRHLAVHLGAAGYDVREVPPTRTTDRRRRRRRPKTDQEDAQAVARETLADPGLPPAKPTLDVSAAQAELSVICDRRRSLIRRRQRLLNEAEGLLNKLPPNLTAGLPRQVAGRLRGVTRLDRTSLPRAAALGEMLDWLAELAEDLDGWEVRIAALEDRLPPLLAATGSTLTEEFGIGLVSAAELVAAVGDPSRFKTEGGFARWCGVAPVAVSSGEGDGDPVRHRLDLLGNRQVNRILYTMSVTQARHLTVAKEYMARKRSEGKSKKEARRAHKRQLAKRVIRRMWTDQRRQKSVNQPPLLEPAAVA